MCPLLRNEPSLSVSPISFFFRWPFIPARHAFLDLPTYYYYLTAWYLWHTRDILNVNISEFCSPSKCCYLSIPPARVETLSASSICVCIYIYISEEVVVYSAWLVARKMCHRVTYYYPHICLALCKRGLHSFAGCSVVCTIEEIEEEKDLGEKKKSWELLHLTNERAIYVLTFTCLLTF